MPRDRLLKGRVQILTGSGGIVPWQRLVLAITTIFLSVVLPTGAIMALTTLIATPMVVRRSLLGLSFTAAEAERIDTDKRGARLSFDCLALLDRDDVGLVLGIDHADERRRR